MLNLLRPLAAITITPGSDGIVINPGTDVSLGGNDYKTGLVEIITKYKYLASIIFALCAVTALIFFITAITRLSTASAANNPMERTRAIKGIFISGISLVLFGGLSIIVGFFWDFMVSLPA